LTTFRADYAEDDEEEEAPPESPAHPLGGKVGHGAATVAQAGDDEQETVWISPWGASAFCVSAMALLQASTLGSWWLTVALAAVGVVLFAGGVWATRERRRVKDRVWLTLGGTVSGAALVLALFAPGLLNRYWAMDIRLARPDVNEQFVVNRDTPLDEGRRMPADESANAATDGIRQEDMFVRLESVKKGTLPKGDGVALLFHVRLINCKHERTIEVEGFVSEHKPVLTDESGQVCAFVEQRMRKQSRTQVVFEASQRVAHIEAADRQDYLLVFAAPAKTTNLKLELPSSAWGRKGTCKFRISNLFEAQVRRSN
jgi:hypothetical protein